MDKIESEKFKTAVRKLKAPKSEGVTSDMALKAGVAFALTMLVIVLIIFCLPDAIVRHEQVHIALGTTSKEMLITWTTLKVVFDEPRVVYGSDQDNLVHIQKVTKVTFRNYYVYRALLKDLKPNSVYYYKVGSEGTGYSEVFSFRTLKHGTDWLPRFAVYGDLGLEEARSLPFLIEEQQAGLIDLILHSGDMAYDLYKKDGQVGHDFMNLIEPLAARVPYMVIPGNHERADNFSHYDARFSMLGDRNKPDHERPLMERLNNHYWSANIGPVHVLAFSAEFYDYADLYGWEQIPRQYAFIEQDLRQANAHRNEQPWIVVMSHKSLYISDSTDQDKGRNVDRPRQRLGVHMYGNQSEPLRYGLEDLFYQHGVDLQIYGHEHMYSRSYPVYNLTVLNGTKSPDNVYDNPNGPVLIVSGAAGSSLPPIRHSDYVLPIIATRNYDFSYTRLKLVDRLHLVLEQFSLTNQIVDHIDLRKDSAKPNWMV